MLRSRTSRPDPHSAWWLRAAAAAVSAGIAVTAGGLVVVAQVREAQDSVAADTVERRTESVAQAAEAEIDSYVSALVLVAAALGADPIDRARFDQVTAPLTELELGGATSIVFLVGAVADDEVPALQRRWRARGAEDLVLEPSPEVGGHIFSIYSRPLDGSSQRRTGIDVAASGPPATALAEASRSGAPAVSPAYQLIIDQQLPPEARQTSFSLTVPVRSDGRQVGWVLMGLRGEDFLGSVLEQASEGVVHLELEAADPAGRATRVASSGPALRRPDLELRRELRVAQASWQLTVSTDRSTVLGPRAVRPTIVLGVSIALAVLVGLLVWLLLSRIARTRIKIREATADLVRSETHAREQATLLRTVVDTADTVGVVVVDEQQQVLLCSPRALEMFGDAVALPGPDAAPTAPTRDAPRPTTKGRARRLDGQPYPAADHPLVRALRGESCDGVEMVLSTDEDDGLRVQVASRPILLPDGRRLALATFRDVTEERRQLAELAGFAGVVAHDLRNPLSVAQGYLEVVRTDDLPRLQVGGHQLDETLQRLDRVHGALHRMGQLIEDLLGYVTARDASFDPRPVELDPLVDEAVADCLAARDPSSPAPLVHLGSLPTVNGDAGRLRQLFANLVGNAFKYVAAGERPVLDITAETASGWTRIRVADRGIGIPEASAHEVFDPFTRSPEVRGTYPGTGLGLAICRRVVEAHGGRLSVIANPGGGSVFLIDLPPGASSRGPSDQHASARPSVAGRVVDH